MSRPNRTLPGLSALRRAALGTVAGTLAGVLLAGSAAASPETLRRGFGNIVGGPMDAILAPFQAGYTLAVNLQDIDDSNGVRLAYAIPGYIWLSGLNLGSGALRTATGLLESVPGILLFPFETDLDPMFDAVETARAFINYDNALAYKVEDKPWLYYNPIVTPFTIRVKWGISYTRADE